MYRMKSGVEKLHNSLSISYDNVASPIHTNMIYRLMRITWKSSNSFFNPRLGNPSPNHDKKIFILITKWLNLDY